ncbi:MAG: shikimate dehydrogenase [Clostridia bacterium]|nr:shikimate dehydrogenase [Clostridia bacterium]
MKYGLIGEKLGHSFSKSVHSLLADYEYELKGISRDKFHEFMAERDFLAINVTIPYKQMVIPYLHFIDENARNIGAVNTIVNKDGKLYGYNTDLYGMQSLLHHAKIDLKGKKVAILGTGGTSKTAGVVARTVSASEIITVSRNKREGVIDYDELYKNHTDTDVIINTTPLGMYPDIYSKAVDLGRFNNLLGVIDAVYNPLRTPLIMEALRRGIPAEGGLYMLVAQAVRASEIFLDTRYEDSKLEWIYRKIKREKENIVLIGMPASGKSTVGRLIAEKCGRPFIDTDALIEERAGISISEIFESMGEEKFRELECETVREVSKETGNIIATGGGVPLRKENTDALCANGKIYFIDRPLEALLPTEDRPLASTKAAITKRYNERYDIYKASADVQIDAGFDAETVVSAILEDFEK